MKKIILLFVLTFATASFGQFKKVETKEEKFTEIGKIQPLGQAPQMICKKHEEKNVYLFMYRDADYKTLVEYESFFIKDVDNAFDSLYNAIIEGFAAKPKDPIVLETDNQFIYIRFVQNFGTLVTLGSSDKSDGAKPKYSPMFNKKQIEKLFAKNK